MSPPLALVNNRAHYHKKNRREILLVLVERSCVFIVCVEFDLSVLLAGVTGVP